MILVALNTEKAFDTVWTCGLISKISENKYPMYIVNIVHSYLQNRTFKILINKSRIGLYNVIEKVSQGSVLSPHLYKIMTHDILMGTNGSAKRRLDIHNKKTLILYMDANKMKLNTANTESNGYHQKKNRRHSE